MNKPRKRINPPDELFVGLMRRGLEAAREGKWLEAVCIQMYVIETYLSYLIRSEIVCRHDISDMETLNEFEQYWSTARFSQLISNYLLIGGDPELAKRLRAYNKKRGDVVHEMESFMSVQELDKAAEEANRDGETILSELETALNQINERLKKLREEPALASNA